MLSGVKFLGYEMCQTSSGIKIKLQLDVAFFCKME